MIQIGTPVPLQIFTIGLYIKFIITYPLFTVLKFCSSRITPRGEPASSVSHYGVHYLETHCSPPLLCLAECEERMSANLSKCHASPPNQLSSQHKSFNLFNSVYWPSNDCSAHLTIIPRIFFQC